MPAGVASAGASERVMTKCWGFVGCRTVTWPNASTTA
jgi:hypothetical protein